MNDPIRRSWLPLLKSEQLQVKPLEQIGANIAPISSQTLLHRFAILFHHSPAVQSPECRKTTSTQYHQQCNATGMARVATRAPTTVASPPGGPNTLAVKELTSLQLGDQIFTGVNV